MTEYGTLAFWEEYRNYVKECLPRHRRVLHMIGLPPLEEVIDLGCGQVMEGFTLAQEAGCHYLGVDRELRLNVVNSRPETLRMAFTAADYRNDIDNILDSAAKVGDSATVLSLFSIEPTAEHSTNAALYRHILEYKNVTQVISAGFYYEGRENEALVEETGGVKSYQTIPSLPLLKDGLHERRVTERGPSKMFGQNVIEVWRVITRLKG